MCTAGLFGVVLGMTLVMTRKGGSHIVHKEKLSCSFVATEPSAKLTWNSQVEMALVRCLGLRKGVLDFVTPH